MRLLLVSQFIVISISVCGQTDSIEKAILYKKILSKEIGQVEYSRLRTKWNQTINGIKKYPELPLDQNGHIHYLFLYKFTDHTKEYLFNRTLEWLAINYGLIPSGIYSNLEDGKIVFRNSLEINFDNTCTYTAVITVKNENLLMEIYNISYQVFYEGHYNNDNWVPEKTLSYNLSQIYPVILKDLAVWRSNLLFLATVDELLNKEKKNLFDYITTYNSSNLF